jgi:hypothetical protein
MSDIPPFQSDGIEMVSMPSGVHVFALEVQNMRWSRHRGFVRFPTKLSQVPDDIIFSDIEMDGAADLVITELSEYGFSFQVTSTLSSKKWTLTEISFNWEAVKQ